VESCSVLATINNFTISEISYRKAGLKKATVNTDMHIVFISINTTVLEVVCHLWSFPIETGHIHISEYWII